MISSSQRPLPTHQTQEANTHALSRIQTRSRSNETISCLRLRQHGHWDRHLYTYLWVGLLLTEHSQFNTKRHLPFSFRQKYKYGLYTTNGCVVLCIMIRPRFKNMRAIHETFFFPGHLYMSEDGSHANSKLSVRDRNACSVVTWRERSGYTLRL